MRNLLSGNAYLLPVLFQDGEGNFSTPDSDSVTYNLYGLAGTVLESGVSVSVDTDATQTVITISASDNTVASGSEPRHLVVDYTVDNLPYELEFVYRVIASCPYAVTPDVARRLVGLDRKELPDDVFDFYEAYLDVQDDCSVLDTKLTAGSPRANRAIALKALINLGPSYYGRMMLTVSSNTKSASRTSYASPADALAALVTQYDDVVATLNGTTADSIDQYSIMAAVSSTVDYITNDDPVVPGEDS